MSQPEHISSIVPRVLALFVRKCGHTTRLLWPKTCQNCEGRGRLDGLICPSCNGLGYHTEKK